MNINAHSPIDLPLNVRKGLEDVESKLSSLKSSDFVSPMLFKPSSHLIKKRGKLIRPALVLLSADFLKEDLKDYVDLAVSAELIHISSLIHDDIIDKDDKRRGIPTVHKQYGQEAAILAGDALLSKAISMSSKYGDNVMRAMATASMQMCAGELLDYSFQKEGKVPTMNECLNIAELKSASLIASCCNVVAIHKNRIYANEMHLFGKDLGLAFQVRDDIIDYIAWARGDMKKPLIPNVVCSIQHEKGKDVTSAILMARELNEKYVRRAARRLGNGINARILKEYASLIMLKI